MAGRKPKDEHKRRDYKQGSMFYDEVRERYIASFSYMDPATGARRYRRKSGKNKGPLNDWLDEMKGLKRSGKSLDPKSATVKEWLTLWLQDYKKDVRATTRESYTGIINSRIVPEIGALKIKDITPLDIQSFIRRIEKKYSPRGVQYTRVILSQAMKDAEEDGLIDRNPVRGKKTKGPRVAKREMTAPESQDVQKFLDSAKQTRFYHLFLFIASTGCRKGEALGLRWADLDFNANAVSIQRTLVYTTEEGIVFNEPKTKAGRRRILLPADVMAAMKQHKLNMKELRLKNADIWQDNDMCFPVQDGTPQNPHNIENAFYRIMKMAGLGDWLRDEAGKIVVDEKKKPKRFLPAWRLHDLRHAHASDLLLDGWDAEAVRERLGHEDVTVTLNIYSHVREELQKRMAKSLEGKYVLG